MALAAGVATLGVTPAAIARETGSRLPQLATTLRYTRRIMWCHGAHLATTIIQANPIDVIGMYLRRYIYTPGSYPITTCWGRLEVSRVRRPMPMAEWPSGTGSCTRFYLSG